MTPDQYTISERFLEVGNGHSIYVHEWGNPKAKVPIFFLHGGPGGSCKDRHKQVFDPRTQRVIFHDQRGSGRSLPSGSLEHNTTKDLVADITHIADKLAIDSFVVTGNSWGSGLALAFALAHPSRVQGLVISGIFTASQKEIDWFDTGAFRVFFPEVWEQYMAATPKAHHKKPTVYHFEQATGADAIAAKKSAYAYETFEGSVVKLDDRFTPSNFDDYDPAGIQIEIHYLKNGCFMPDRYILDNAHKLTMPIYIIQGRYDMVCPPETAYELSKRAPNSELYFTIDGHGGGHESWNLIKSHLAQLCK